MKNLKVSIQGNDAHTTLPRTLLRVIAHLVQKERPYSPVAPTDLELDMYEQTGNGCIDVRIDDETGALVGAGVITCSIDPHVGEMLHYAWMYIVPHYRHTHAAAEFIRALREACRYADLQWYGYTIEKRPQVFETRYHKLRS